MNIPASVENVGSSMSHSRTIMLKADPLRDPLPPCNSSSSGSSGFGSSVFVPMWGCWVPVAPVAPVARLATVDEPKVKKRKRTVDGDDVFADMEMDDDCWGYGAAAVGMEEDAVYSSQSSDNNLPLTPEDRMLLNM